MASDPQFRKSPARPHPLSLDTIGKLIDHGYEVFLWCRTCKSVGDIDLAWLAEQVGRDGMFVGRRWPVQCLACGNDDIETRITAREKVVGQARPRPGNDPPSSGTRMPQRPKHDPYATEEARQGAITKRLGWC
jgi:hypothetical protein